MPTNPSNQTPTSDRDPVCEMNVNPATAKHVHEHNGKTYYFCSAGCIEKFKKDPAKYVSGTPARQSGLVMLGAAKPSPTAHHHPPPSSQLLKVSPNAAAGSAAYVC